MEIRRAAARSSDCVFRKYMQRAQHSNVCKLAKVAPFPFYTFRHTCLHAVLRTLAPYTLAYLAAHSDFSTTGRYVHPPVQTTGGAMGRGAGGKGWAQFRNPTKAQNHLRQYFNENGMDSWSGREDSDLRPSGSEAYDLRYLLD
jgi:hypothetical protein